MVIFSDASLFSVIRCRITVRTSLRLRRISLWLNRHQVQGSGSSPGKGIISRPWQNLLPQKTVGTTPCPRFRITDPVALPFPEANPIVAHGVGVHRITAPANCLCLKGMEQRPNQILWF